MKIALVEMECPWKDIEGNFLKIKNFAEKAKEKHAEIICFPELSLTGYGIEKIDDLLFSEIQKCENEILSLAADLKIDIIYGTITRKDTKEYIAQKIATSMGKENVYLKTHPGIRESAVFAKGDFLDVFKTSWGTTIGIQLCSDNHYPEAAIQLALQGAQIVFAPFAVPGRANERKAIWQKYLLARAYDNRVFLLATNQVGKTQNARCFAGGSICYNPNGEILAEDFSGKENMLFVGIDLKEYDKYHSGDLSHKNKCFVTTRRKEIYIR